MKRVILALVPFAFFWTCTSEKDSSRLVVRDSAGITVVESVAPAWGEGEGWTVDLTPLVDLAEAGDGPDYEFFLATDATRLSDGSFVVADDSSDEIRIFSPTGEYRKTLGRNGSGPGEFQRLDQVLAPNGDSILAYDFWGSRVTVFDPEGEMARIVSLDGSQRSRPLFPLGDNGYVGKSTDFAGFGDELGLRRWRHPIVRVDPQGSVVDTLTTIPGAESVVFSQGDARALWGKNGHLAVRGDEIYLGTADSVEYKVFAPDGHLQRIVRIPGYDLSLSGSQIEREREAYFPDSLPPNPVFREVMDAQPNRDHRPGYEDMVIDESGNVWVKAFKGQHERREPTNWLVFDATGKWLGSVVLPPRFEVFRIGPDWILGKRPDELDVEHIQLLALSR